MICTTATQQQNVSMYSSYQYTSMKFITSLYTTFSRLLSLPGVALKSVEIIQLYNIFGCLWMYLVI